MKTRILSIIVGLMLMAASASAIPISKIVGAAVNGPQVLGPGTLGALCTSPSVCPDMWDVMASEGEGVFYGDHAVGAALSTCLKSIDFGITFSNCPTNYPVTTVNRELDVTGNSSILSMRFEGVGFAGCRLDKSTDSGTSWTTINIVTGANLSCNPVGTGGGVNGREQLRCVDNVCLAIINNAASGLDRIYRSNDNGDTWTLVFTSTAGSYAGIYFDGTYGFASTFDTIFGQAWSTDDGFSWTEQASVSIVNRICGPGVFATITGLTEGVVFPCTDAGLTQFRFNEFTFAAATSASTRPTLPATFNATQANQLAQRSVNRLYAFILSNAAVGSIWYSADGAVTWYDITTGVIPTITRPYEFRIVNGDLYFTFQSAGGINMARISGG